MLFRTKETARATGDMSPSTRGRRGRDGDDDDTALVAAVEAHGDGPPPSGAEVRGAFDVMRDAEARVPTARVGALVRALGAHVEAGERDMLRKCEEVVDKNSLGWFELGKVRRRRRRRRREEPTRGTDPGVARERFFAGKRVTARLSVCTESTVCDSPILVDRLLGFVRADRMTHWLTHD